MFFSNIIPTIKSCLKDKFIITSGRATRYEFWVFNVFAILVRVVLYPINFVQYLGILYAVVSFFLFIAQYTTVVRRLHDTNRGTHHIFPVVIGVIITLVGFVMVNTLIQHIGEAVSVVGFVYLVVLCCLKGTNGPNRYGEVATIPTK